MTSRKVLLVEDEERLLKLFADRIRKQGYEVLTAENGEEAWRIFQKAHFLVVVTDLRMPLKDGMEILTDIKRSSPSTRVIVMTAFGNSDKAIQALNSHAFFWVQKGGPGTGEKIVEAIEKAFAEIEIQTKAEREMLSFLTHTLYSAVSGGPKTVERVLRYAQSALGARYREDEVYRTINNIARLNSIFISITNLLDAYQVFINEPEVFREKWREEEAGEFSLADLFSAVLRQSFASLLFEEFNLEPLKRILSKQQGNSLEEVRETFLAEVFLPEDLDLKGLVTWLKRYFPLITIEIERQQPSFDPEGVRRPFLFAILAEIIYNALKYTDAREPVELHWKLQGDTYVFSCRNTFSDASTRRSGSQKGLAFLENLTRMIDGAHLRIQASAGVFSVELSIDSNALSAGGTR